VLSDVTPRRIFAHRASIDMRKSFDGLIALVRSALGEDPLSGSLYVFFNRRGNYLKLIYWDRTGFCLFAKRLEHGRFTLPGEQSKQELSEQMFRLILDGIPLGKRARMR
jgi:transposase